MRNEVTKFSGVHSTGILNGGINIGRAEFGKIFMLTWGLL
jgi:hypothetical protein